MSEADKLQITVLMGGPSSEREVSLLSGEAIAGGLEQAGHAVRRADISPDDTSALDADDIDVVFIALHGEFGESGVVQQLCEARRLPYTGSGVRASQLGMDKAASKQLFRKAGLVTADWMIVEEFHQPEKVHNWLRDYPLPVVAKPVGGGSSVDVTICRDGQTRDKALESLLDNYERAMIEAFIPGREFTVGILGEKPLPIIEITHDNAFYDYHAKYADNAGTQYLFDHGLDSTVVQRLSDDALAAHRALDCRDMSRVDFILDANNIPYVLEINTIPGFTSHSLLPMAAQKRGINFVELVDRIAKMAYSRHADRTCCCID